MPTLEQVREPFQVDPRDLNPSALDFQSPVVTEALNGLYLPEAAFSTLITEPEFREYLHDGGYSFYEDLEIPTDDRGRVDFMGIHAPVVPRIVARHEPMLLGLSGFENQYVTTHGATDGINRLLSAWSGSGKMTELCYLEGDYFGYQKEASGISCPTKTVRSLEEAGEPVKGRVWLVSNPSAVDGNWHKAEVWQKFVEDGHTIILDLAYIDLTTAQHQLDVSASNIEALLITPSKPFGLVKKRYPAIACTREGVKSLFFGQHFRSIPHILNSLALHETFKPHEIAGLHKDQQIAICRAIERAVAIEKDARRKITPSHSFLNATGSGPLPPEFDRHALPSGGYRFRLSTTLKQFELQNESENALHEGSDS